MNPILPENCFVPDAEARLMPDGRLYIYGSWDISGSKEYCSRELHCFSTDDMKNWKDHGVIFRNDQHFVGIPWNPKTPLYAPDCIHNNGKYYLYVCGSGREEGVAVADSPIGPYSPAERITLADGDGIDPTVFVDRDGRAYYFWGQFSLRGGELCEDMKTLKAETVKRDLLTEWEHGFHEGASIRRRGDKYYMVYTDISRGRATCLSYAMADHPLGPYRKCGVIIDNVYCDPESWNNHGSIAELGGTWYVFYHRSSQNGNTSRRVCAEPITFDDKGYIAEVKQTSCGADTAIDAKNVIPARSACRMMGKCYIAPKDGREVLISQKGGHWGVSDWAEFRSLDFGEKAYDLLSVKVKGKGSIVAMIEDGCTLGSVEFDAEDAREALAEIIPTLGIHTLWLFLKGDFELLEFYFKNK